MTMLTSSPEESFACDIRIAGSFRSSRSTRDSIVVSCVFLCDADVNTIASFGWMLTQTKTSISTERQYVKSQHQHVYKTTVHRTNSASYYYMVWSIKATYMHWMYVIPACRLQRAEPVGPVDASIVSAHGCRPVRPLTGHATLSTRPWRRQNPRRINTGRDPLRDGPVVRRRRHSVGRRFLPRARVNYRMRFGSWTARALRPAPPTASPQSTRQAAGTCQPTDELVPRWPMARPRSSITVVAISGLPGNGCRSKSITTVGRSAYLWARPGGGIRRRQRRWWRGARNREAIVVQFPGVPPRGRGGGTAARRKVGKRGGTAPRATAIAAGARRTTTGAVAIIWRDSSGCCLLLATDERGCTAAAEQCPKEAATVTAAAVAALTMTTGCLVVKLIREFYRVSDVVQWWFNRLVDTSQLRADARRVQRLESIGIQRISISHSALRNSHRFRHRSPLIAIRPTMQTKRDPFLMNYVISQLRQSLLHFMPQQRIRKLWSRLHVQSTEGCPMTQLVFRANRSPWLVHWVRGELDPILKANDVITNIKNHERQTILRTWLISVSDQF